MASSRSHSFDVTFRVVLTLPDVSETLGPVITEQDFADADQGVDAAMDYLLPRNAGPDILGPSATISSVVYRLAFGRCAGAISLVGEGRTVPRRATLGRVADGGEGRVSPAALSAYQRKNWHGIPLI
jgi:hypothetical protein